MIESRFRMLACSLLGLRFTHSMQKVAGGKSVVVPAEMREL